jgi:predicted RNase H-like nuclease
MRNGNTKPGMNEKPGEVKEAISLMNEPLMEKTKGYKCIGIDGTKGGWIAACLESGVIDIKMFATIDELCAEYSYSDSIIIDIPIGLPENSRDIRPDSELRKRLRCKASSVFSTPCRQAIYAEDKQTAKEKNSEILGKSLSEQSLAIKSKIKEVDEFLQKNKAWKNRLVESHPEYAFMIMNEGLPIYESKKTKEGFDIRLSLLRQHIQNIDQLLDNIKLQSGMKKRFDDIIDAICLAVMGHLGKTNKFLYIPDKPTEDKTGLMMQIVYAMIK